MTQKKIIAVAGATGAQGGGLVRAILNDKNSDFAVRALTRDAGSDKARALAEMGAEVVQADVHDAGSVTKAFEGAYGAYCVTFFWAHFSPETEFREASNLAQAAKAANLQHVIWSTLEDTRKSIPLDDPRMPVLLGKYSVPHFDVKAEADPVFEATGLPVTYLLASFYWENFINVGAGPKENPDGSLTLSMPMASKKLAGIASEDIGKTAYGIFMRGPELAGKRIGVASDHLTGNELAAKFSKAFGRPVNYKAVPFDVYRGLNFSGAEEMGNMFQFYADFEKLVGDIRNIDYTRELNPELKSFDEWLRENKDRIPLTNG